MPLLASFHGPCVVWTDLRHPSFRHTFSEKTSFKYTNGCDDDGAICAEEDCTDAFHASDETFVQVACTVDNVRLFFNTFALLDRIDDPLLLDRLTSRSHSASS